MSNLDTLSLNQIEAKIDDKFNNLFKPFGNKTKMQIMEDIDELRNELKKRLHGTN